MRIERVCVLGGTGFVGRHVVHQLHREGYKVRVMTRDLVRNKDLRVMPGVEVMEGSPLQESDLDRHFADCQAVINLVGILAEKRSSRIDFPPQRRGDFHTAHVELPRKVVKACRRAGIARLLHMSANGADPLGPSLYQQTKGLGARIVREAGEPRTASTGMGWLNGPKMTQAEALDVTLFEPSIVFGNGDSFFTRFARLVRRTPLGFPLARADTRFAPVWVEDVAAAFARAVAEPRTFGQTYTLCGPHEYTFADLVRIVIDLQGLSRQVWPLPGWAARLQAEILERVPGKPMTTDQLRSLAWDNTCDGPFPEVFGIEPQALEAVVPTYVGDRERPMEDLYQYRARARRDDHS